MSYVSVCCEVKALKARSAEGWRMNGEIVHEWFECSNCKGVCDIVEPLPTLNHKDDDNEQRERICSDTPSTTYRSTEAAPSEQKERDSIA